MVLATSMRSLMRWRQLVFDPETSGRFWSRVDTTSDCWLWQRGKTTAGYGTFRAAGQRQVYAHRYAYQQVKGEIPGGLELDHLCRTPACVRPDHLEAVTHRENMLRGNGRASLNASRTHCPKGHPYDLFNTEYTRVGRRCKRCHSDEESLRGRLQRRKRGLKREPYGLSAPLAGSLE